MDVGDLALIPELIDKCDHGVSEMVKVTDPSFNAVFWLENLKHQYITTAKAFESATTSSDIDSDLIETLTESLTSLDKEIQQIERDLSLGNPVAADPETVRLKINIFSFFPTI